VIKEGDTVLLTGKRRIVVRVKHGMSRIGSGTADLSRLIGMEYGEKLELWGHEYGVYPASHSDMLEDFERGPQVILPKDSSLILHLCDIKSGDTVLESGVGSGWMTASLVRAVMPKGKVISYDISERSVTIAQKNLEKAGLSDFSEIRKGDIRQVSMETVFDSAVLDMPAPWEAMKNISSALRPGGHLCVYVPTCNQVEKTVLAMKEGFFDISARELIERELSVKENATRPSYSGLMHTGYIIHGRKA